MSFATGSPTTKLTSFLQQAPTEMIAPSFNLPTLVEREETLDHETTSNMDAIASSPNPPTDYLEPAAEMPSPLAVKTPTTAGRVRPGAIEMHPSRFQSTAKKMASTRRMSLAPGSPYLHSPTRDVASKTATYEALNFPQVSQNPFSSPNFEFRYGRPSADLSTEAQRIMDEVREQAARIKVDLVTHEREQLQKESDAEVLHGIGERKIAHGKGKAGRFSDAHTDQFKKMNSIANHPSSFRTDATRLPSAMKSLKRSNSKAGLGKPEGPIKQTVSTKNLTDYSTDTSYQGQESPAKRHKQVHEPTVAARNAHVSTPQTTKVGLVSTPKWTAGRGSSMATSTVTTPTQASLARAASVKSLKTHSMIPSLAHSPSKRVTSTPFSRKATQPQTEGNNKYKNAFTNGLMSVKSILRRPQTRFSDDPLKLAAGTHVATPIKAQNATINDLDKPLPSIAQDAPDTPSHRAEKHVMFSSSPTAVTMNIGTPGTPSPTKLSGHHTSIHTKVSYPTIQFGDVGPLSPTPVGGDSPSKVRASMAGPGDFTFRSGKTISFGPKSNTSSSTIRPVRPSDASAVVRMSSPRLLELPNVPHGLSNKKRKHDSDIDETAEDKENEAEYPQESPSKRTKTTAHVDRGNTFSINANIGKSMTPTASRLPKSKGRSVLSMARLNALSKPKERK